MKFYDSVENTVIAHANLLLIKAGLTTFSDEEGKFVFTHIPVGEDIVKCLFIGYGTPRRYNVTIYEDSISFIRINLTQCQYDIFGNNANPRTNQALPFPGAWFFHYYGVDLA